MFSSLKKSEGHLLLCSELRVYLMAQNSNNNLVSLSLQGWNIFIFTFGANGLLCTGTSLTFHDCKLIFTEVLLLTVKDLYRDIL